MEVVVYTDASYCQLTKVAACGYIILVNNEAVKHEIIILRGVRTSMLAEAHAIVYGLQCAFLTNDVHRVILHTDCKNAINPRKINNEIPFPEMRDTIDEMLRYGVSVHLRKVRAHDLNKWNNKVDHSVINALRKYLNGTPSSVR